MDRDARSGGGIHALPIHSTVVVLFVLTMVVLATAVAPRHAHGFREARVAREQADVNAVAQAIYLYSIHTGRFPHTLAELTVVVANSGGKIEGPYLRTVPVPPSGGRPPWPVTYGYVVKESGTFTVFAAGDNALVTAR